MTVAQPGEKANANQWWHILALIAGLDATPTQKYLLTLVLRHTHSRKGFAWATQETLADEMCVDVSTVERIFRWAKGLDLINVRRVRIGKSPADQYNEYALNVRRLTQQQRETKHPAPAQGDSGAEHPSPMRGDSVEHPAPMLPNTPHLTSEHPAFEARTPRTHAGEGFEVQQVVSNSGEETSSSGAKPDDDVLKEKMERLRRQHPRFVEACERIVLDRASAMGENVASPDRYVQAALPSLLQEPDLIVEIANALNMRKLSEAQGLYDAAVETFTKEPPAPPPFPDFKNLTPWQRARSFWLLADYHGLIPRYDHKAVQKLLRRTFGSHNVQSFDEATYRRAWALLNQQPEVVH